MSQFFLKIRIRKQMLDESSVGAFSQLGASFFAAARARLAEPRADATWMWFSRDGGDHGEMVQSIGKCPTKTAGNLNMSCWKRRLPFGRLHFWVPWCRFPRCKSWVRRAFWALNRGLFFVGSPILPK